MLSCVIYTIIKNYAFIDYLACQSKKLSEIPVGSGGGYKHGDRSFDRILGIEIPDFLINLMYCHGFFKNKNYAVILKFPKGILKYYSQKDLLFWNAIIIIWKNFQMMQNKELVQKTQIIQKKIITCINTIPSKSTHA